MFIHASSIFFQHFTLNYTDCVLGSACCQSPGGLLCLNTSPLVKKIPLDSFKWNVILSYYTYSYITNIQLYLKHATQL